MSLYVSFLKDIIRLLGEILAELKKQNTSTT